MYFSKCDGSTVTNNCHLANFFVLFNLEKPLLLPRIVAHLGKKTAGVFLLFLEETMSKKSKKQCARCERLEEVTEGLLCEIGGLEEQLEEQEEVGLFVPEELKPALLSFLEVERYRLTQDLLETRPGDEVYPYLVEKMNDVNNLRDLFGGRPGKLAVEFTFQVG